MQESTHSSEHPIKQAKTCGRSLPFVESTERAKPNIKEEAVIRMLLCYNSDELLRLYVVQYLIESSVLRKTFQENSSGGTINW
jgi:hypothetical protein